MLRHLLLVALFVAAGASAQTPPPDLTLTEIVGPGQVSQPLAVRHAGDGSGRLFIVQKNGVIRLYKNGALVATPFLSISVATSSEQGLLGLAFHPDYDGTAERRFYVAYTSTESGNPQRIAEFQTTAGDPDTADASTRREVIRVLDLAGNHNGGDIVFGPDGFLYWSMGDGGPQGDPNGFAQCRWKKPADGNPANCSPGAGTNYFLLGKIIRIDPTQTTASATAEMCAATEGQPAGYRIPADNPFVGSSNTCDEIAHYGMRNPWRISFDRETGELLIADVGQGTWEETSVIPAGALGRNLGWRCFEGTEPYGSPRCNDIWRDGLESVPWVVFPFQTYQHVSGRCSITGGYRYRGPIVSMRGIYISGDYCTGEIYFSTRNPDGSWSPALTQLNIWQNTPYSIAGFGEDEAGNVYVTNISTNASVAAVWRFTSVMGGAPP